MPRQHAHAGDLNQMPRLLALALIAELVGMITTLPCLIETTPITMGLCFAVGIPLLGAGFASYALVVIADLRRHQVL